MFAYITRSSLISSLVYLYSINIFLLTSKIRNVLLLYIMLFFGIFFHVNIYGDITNAV